MRKKIKYQIKKNYNMKKNTEQLLQKQNNRYINYKELLRSFAELENMLKMMEDNFKINDSENN